MYSPGLIYKALEIALLSLFSLAVSFRGTGKGRVVHQLRGGKLDLLKHLSPLSQVSFFPLLLFALRAKVVMGDRRAFWMPKWAVKRLQPRAPVKNALIKAYHDRTGVQTKQVCDSFSASFCYEVTHAVQQETEKAMDGSLERCCSLQLISPCSQYEYAFHTIELCPHHHYFHSVLYEEVDISGLKQAYPFN